MVKSELFIFPPVKFQGSKSLDNRPCTSQALPAENAALSGNLWAARQCLLFARWGGTHSQPEL